MILEGKIHEIQDTMQKTESFKVRNFVLDNGDRYSPYVMFQLTNDNCGVFEDSHIQEGDNVEVSFNVGGKDYKDKNTGETKYFNILTAWKIVLRQ